MGLDPQKFEPLSVQSDREEPIADVEVAGHYVTLLGTAHVSRASAEKVKQLLGTDDYDAVAVELCPSRYNAIIDPDSLARLDIFRVLREGRAASVAAGLALGAFQQRIAEQFGIHPGEEMRVAIDLAHKAELPILLIDREVSVTLRRVYGNVSLWRRLNLMAGFLAAIVSREKITEEEIEKLKQGDILETTFSQFANQAQDLYKPLIEERDLYMAARLQDEIEHSEYHRILAVVGAGHLKGIKSRLGQGLSSATTLIGELDRIPPARFSFKFLSWFIVALILIGFGIGFMRNTQLGLEMVIEWIVINGSLSALGALIAGGHPLTVATAFVAAPITSLNPTVGAGMVAGAAEVYLRKPRVGDFSRLREDVMHLRGWWRNRIARVLLVFALSTLGSAIGTYLAGFRIVGRLAGG